MGKSHKKLRKQIQSSKELIMVGKTPENHPVMKNVFYLYAEQGVDLDTIFWYFKEKNFIVDWVDFINCALAHKWTWQKITDIINFNFKSVNGEKDTNEVLIRTKKIFITTMGVKK